MPLLLTSLLVTTAAFADEDPRRMQAEAAYQEGLKLHDRDREAEALEKFRKAYALFPSPNTLVAMARTEQLLSQRLAALRHFREAIRHPMITQGSSDIAKKYIAELEPHFARVELRGPKGLVVALRGDEYILPISNVVDLEPGEVRASAMFGREHYEGHSQAEAGKLTVLELSPTSSSPPADHVEPPPVTGSGSFWDTGRIVGVALVGVGAVSFTASALFDSSSLSHSDRAGELSRQLGPTGCSTSAPPQQCSELASERDGVDRDSTLSTVFVVSGIAAAATGAALFLWPRGSSTRVVPSAASRSAGVFIVGTF